MVTQVGAAPIPAAPPAARSQVQVNPESCTILTRSGSLIARGSVQPRDPSIPGEAYDLEVTNVEPRGALEALFYKGRPDIVLRAGSDAQILLRIDHITGPPGRRTYFLLQAV